MGRRAREEAALRALARKVWGESYYERHAAPRAAGRRHRLTAVGGIGVGIPLLLSAFAMVAFSTAASAHTSTIDISCTKVVFVYQSFEAVTATSHESVSIDGVEVAQRDFTFNGPAATHTITISVGSGSHSVQASDHWSYNGRPQGAAYAHQDLSWCSPQPTTTTTCPPSTTSTSASTTTSTAPASTTSTSSSTSTSTTVPETTSTSTSTSTSTMPETSTTIGTETSTSSPASSTTTTIAGSSTTSSTVPERVEGSTSTTSPVREQGSTSPPTTAAPHGNLPFTGAGGLPLVVALAALGVGLLAIGLASLRRVVSPRTPRAR